MDIHIDYQMNRESSQPCNEVKIKIRDKTPCQYDNGVKLRRINIDGDNYWYNHDKLERDIDLLIEYDNITKKECIFYFFCLV